MIVRNFEPNDFSEVLEIESEAFAEHNPFIYMSFYEMNSECFLVAEEREHITGFVVGYQISGEEGRIFSLAVREHYRGYGIGTRLLDTVTHIFREKMLSFASLEVRLSNYEAQRLYQKIGFIPCWIQHNYYSDGEDGIVMKKRLTPVTRSATGSFLHTVPFRTVKSVYRLDII